MLNAEASLSWHLFVECPHCEEDIDLADSPYDDEGYFSEPLFNNRWDEIGGKEVECPKCKNIFQVFAVVY